MADRLPDKDTVFHGLLLLDQRPIPLALKSNGTRVAPGVELGRQEGEYAVAACRYDVQPKDMRKTIIRYHLGSLVFPCYARGPMYHAPVC